MARDIGSLGPPGIPCKVRWIIEPRSRLRGKWPLVLRYLKEMYPPSEQPEGFPDPPFAPRQALVKELRKRHPSLVRLDEATLDTAIAEYDIEIRNSSE